MCRLKSGIILKDRVYIPDHDGHQEMLAELKIEDTRENAERLFVRAELYPRDNDIFTDPDTWIYRVEQDILPDWYVAEADEARMREAVKTWYAAHVHIGEDNLTVNGGRHWIKGGQNISICGNATVKRICGNATVKYISDNATVEGICDNVTVEFICGNATVEGIYDNATVKRICDNATVKYISDNATVEGICDNVTVEFIWDNATVKYIRGNATVKRICGNATVKRICGNATVKRISDNATVEDISDNATVIISGVMEWANTDKAVVQDNALIIDRYRKQIIHSGNFALKKSGEE